MLSEPALVFTIAVKAAIGSSPSAIIVILAVSCAPNSSVTVTLSVCSPAAYEFVKVSEPQLYVSPPTGEVEEEAEKLTEPSAAIT